jgi:hypothetical protein
MKTLKINCSKIDKSALFEGKNGKYLDLVLFENKGGVDQYGNHGFVTQDIGRERREAGERGPIIGNWKEVGGFVPQQPTQHEQAKQNAYQPHLDADGDEIPF